MNGKHNSVLEMGQAIFVVALMMIALIGALGLAVDGGGLAFLYRDVQNAADAAATAAAYARCTGGDVTVAALAAAANNGFANSGTNSVVVQSPPSTGPGVGNPNFVEVRVRAAKPAYFIQLLFPAGLEAAAGAVGQCTPGVANSAPAYAMIGLGPTGGVAASCHGTCDGTEARRVTIEGNVLTAVGYNWDDGANLATVSGTVTSVSVPPVNPLIELNASMYQPGGSVWDRAPGTQRWSFSGDQTLSNPAPGLYFVNGNVTVNASTNLTVTVVATGRIRFNMNSHSLTGFIDELVAYSPLNLTCNDNVVVVHDGQGDSRGIVYAPAGQIEILYRGGTWTGALIGEWVDWWGHDGTPVSTLRTLPLASPPMVSLAR